MAPYADAPLCPDHDSTHWHGVWDAARGCHYDHEHGDDPALGNAYFRPLAYGSGQTIGFVWAASDHENTMQHGGYKINVRTSEHNPWPACGQDFNSDFQSYQPDNCIVASRIQYYQIGGTMASLARYHSYYAEYYACAYPDFTQCGVMRIGGWADLGSLHAPHYNGRVVRPGGTVDFGPGSTYGGAGMQLVMNLEADGPDLPPQSGEPYIFDRPASEAPDYAGWVPQLTDNMSQWSMNDLDCEPIPDGHPCHNRYARFFTTVGDAWNLLNKDDPNNPYWFCRDGQCPYNGSIHGLGEVTTFVPPEWGESGFATWTGYTDRWGNPVDGCSVPSLDCVPLAFEHYPTGLSVNVTDAGCGCTGQLEYDVSPSGVWWIRFPN
jgi:hypothetical protein